MKKNFLKGLLISFALAVSGFSSAGLILKTNSVTAPDSNGTALEINLINQSGLTTAYTSDVTDFDTFVSSTTHNSLCGDKCRVNVPIISFPINIDLF